MAQRLPCPTPVTDARIDCDRWQGARDLCIRHAVVGRKIARQLRMRRMQHWDASCFRLFCSIPIDPLPLNRLARAHASQRAARSFADGRPLAMEIAFSRPKDGHTRIPADRPDRMRYRRRRTFAIQPRALAFHIPREVRKILIGRSQMQFFESLRRSTSNCAYPKPIPRPCQTLGSPWLTKVRNCPGFHDVFVEKSGPLCLFAYKAKTNSARSDSSLTSPLSRGAS